MEDRSAESIREWLAELLAAAVEVPLPEIDPERPINEYGLDSLGALGLKLDVEERLGLTIPLASFLDGWSLDRLAGALAQASASPDAALALFATAPAPLGRGSGRPGSSAGASGDYPASRGQAAIWFLDRLAPDSPAYHIVQAVRVRGALDVGALRQAFQALVDRHAALRTTFPSESGRPLQRVSPSAEVAFAEVDAAHWTAAALAAEVAASGYLPFDLERGPLLRVGLFRIGPAEHVLSIAVHHIVADLWSLALLMKELVAAYLALRAGEEPVLESLPGQYPDFALWQWDMLAGAEGERHWHYWRDRLAGAPTVLELPTDHPRPPVQTYRGDAHGFALGAELTARVRALGVEQGTTLYATLLAAFQVLLHRYSGQDDLLVASPAAGRTRREWASAVGYFANPLVLRADLAGNPTFVELLERTREASSRRSITRTSRSPSWSSGCRSARDASRSPLFQVMFGLQNAPGADGSTIGAFALASAGASLDLGGLALEPLALPERGSQLDLTLVVAETADELTASFTYNADLFDGTTIRRMARHWTILLESLAADPARPIASLALLAPDERRQVVVEWNAHRARAARDAACTSSSRSRPPRPPKRSRSRPATLA